MSIRPEDAQDVRVENLIALVEQVEKVSIESIESLVSLFPAGSMAAGSWKPWPDRRLACVSLLGAAHRLAPLATRSQ